MEVDSWITITILVNFIALVFQIGAYTAPMWSWYQSSSLYKGIGLWYSVGCSGTNCNTQGAQVTDALFDLPEFVALRVLQSVGTAGVVTLVIFLIVYKMSYTGRWSNKSSLGTINLAAFVLCLFTVLVLLASAAVYAAYFYGEFLYVNNENNDKTSLPWSPMMSLLAALILIIVCVFIRLNCRPETFSGNIPMSGDAKFDLHPHVQNGNASRYYNQTPYIEDRERYVVDDRPVQSRVRDEYDDRRNGQQSYEQRRTYINRAFITEAPEQPVVYTKPASREFRENRDREMGHTIYTGNGFSYLKGEVNRPDREEVRYGRPVALAEYSSSRTHNADDYYEDLRASSRPRGEFSSSSRAYPAQTSNVYIYRPHQF